MERGYHWWLLHLNFGTYLSYPWSRGIGREDGNGFGDNYAVEALKRKFDKITAIKMQVFRRTKLCQLTSLAASFIGFHLQNHVVGSFKSLCNWLKFSNTNKPPGSPLRWPSLRNSRSACVLILLNILGYNSSVPTQSSNSCRRPVYPQFQYFEKSKVFAEGSVKAFSSLETVCGMF